MTTRLLERIVEARALIARDGRSIREAAGLTLDEVAGALGVSRAAVSRWERGQGKPPPTVALEWARLLAGLRRRLAAVA